MISNVYFVYFIFYNAPVQIQICFNLSLFLKKLQLYISMVKDIKIFLQKVKVIPDYIHRTECQIRLSVLITMSKDVLALIPKSASDSYCFHATYCYSAVIYMRCHQFQCSTDVRMGICGPSFKLRWVINWRNEIDDLCFSVDKDVNRKLIYVRHLLLFRGTNTCRYLLLIYIK